ncbi:MAG: DUF4271 domain-containing protein [Flavobacteriales bacterium]|nr:DUF4271 domain-containing protein [Flavobacteriales bacterium]
MSWYKTYYNQKFGFIGTYLISDSPVKLLSREERVWSGNSTLWLALGLSSLVAIFITQANIIYNIIPPSQASMNVVFLVTLLISWGVSIARVVSLQTVGFIFEIKHITIEHVYSIILNTLFTGLLLFPIIISISFTQVFNPKTLVIIGFSIIGALFLYRIARLTIKAFSQKNYSRFYIILYICTLEILPVLVLFKTLVLMKLR